MVNKVVKTKYGQCEWYLNSEHNFVHIFNLYITPEYRRQGKGKELLLKTIDEIKLSGWRQKICIVAIPRENSIKVENLKTFYKKLGLEVYEYYG